MVGKQRNNNDCNSLWAYLSREYSSHFASHITSNESISIEIVIVMTTHAFCPYLQWERDAELIANFFSRWQYKRSTFNIPLMFWWEITFKQHDPIITIVNMNCKRYENFTVLRYIQNNWQKLSSFHGCIRQWIDQKEK